MQSAECSADKSLLHKHNKGKVAVDRLIVHSDYRRNKMASEEDTFQPANEVVAPESLVPQWTLLDSILHVALIVGALFQFYCIFYAILVSSGSGKGVSDQPVEDDKVEQCNDTSSRRDKKKRRSKQDWHLLSNFVHFVCVFFTLMVTSAASLLRSEILSAIKRIHMFRCFSTVCCFSEAQLNRNQQFTSFIVEILGFVAIVLRLWLVQISSASWTISANS